MPLGITPILITSAIASSAFLLAGATGSPDPMTLAHDAARAAQTVIQMSEERVLLIALGGGLLGALVAYGFNLFRGTPRQQAMRFVASAVAAMLSAPPYMLWRDIPQTVIPTISVAGACGLLAHMAIPIITDIFPRFLRSTLTKGMPSEDGKESKRIDP